MGRLWTDKDFADNVRRVSNMADLLRAIGMKPAGGNYQTAYSVIRRLGLNTSHWNGKCHRKGVRPSNSREAAPYGEILVEHSTYSRTRIKHRLIKDGLLKNVCAVCKMSAEWESKPLVLVLDHKNGTNDDYRIENLQLLCPNCNSQQPTFAGRNMKGSRREGSQSCSNCSKPLKCARKTGKCMRCCRKRKANQTALSKAVSRPTKINWPTASKLRTMVWKEPSVKVAENLGVSSNAVKKRCAKLSVPTPPRGYWQKLKAGKL